MSSGRFEIPTQLGEPAHAGLFAEYASELLLKSSAFALTGEAEFLGEDISLNQVANTLDSSPVVLASSETSVAGASSAALATSAASAEDVCATPSPVIENETVVEPGCAGFIQASREWAQDAIQNGAGPDTYPEGSIPDRLIEAEISGNGSAVATQIAIEQGFYRPEAIKESFNLFAGSRFVMTQEAGMQILNPNGSVAHTLWSPCDGDGAAYTGQRMIDTVPCSDVTPEPEPKAEPVYVAPLVVEPTPEPVVVETKPEPIPEPELEPITDRVRIFQTFAYGCVGGECGLVPTMFLTFDSVEDAHEFFDSAEGKEMLKTLLAGGNNLGNCVYITDGHGTLQQISLVTEDHRVGGRTVRQIVLGPDGAPSLSGELEESRFIERNSSGRERSYTLEEDDFENRYSRGIGEVSEADNTRLPQVKDMRGATPGVGGVQELWLNPETGRWEYVPLENAIAEGELAIVAAAGLTEAEYALLKTLPLPDEFYDPNASVSERARALREAVERYNEVNGTNIELSKDGSKNLARIISEQAFGKEADLDLFEEKFIQSNPQLIARSEYGGTPTTLEDAIEVSARNREILIRAMTLSPRQAN